MKHSELLNLALRVQRKLEAMESTYSVHVSISKAVGNYIVLVHSTKESIHFEGIPTEEQLINTAIKAGLPKYIPISTACTNLFDQQLYWSSRHIPCTLESIASSTELIVFIKGTVSTVQLTDCFTKD